MATRLWACDVVDQYGEGYAVVYSENAALAAERAARAVQVLEEEGVEEALTTTKARRVSREVLPEWAQSELRGDEYVALRV